MLVDSLGRAAGLYRRTTVTRSALALLVANAIPLIGVLFFGWSLLTILVIYWLENGIVGFWTVPRIALARGTLIPIPPAIPDDAALAATGDPRRAATLQAAWQALRTRQLSAAMAARSPQPTDDAASAAQLAEIQGAMQRMSAIARFPMALFFLIHYGLFWVVHGIFVFALPGFAGFTGGSCNDLVPVPGDLPGSLPGVIPGLASCPAGAFGEVLWGSVAFAAVALFISHGASFFLNYLGRGEYRTTAPTRAMAAPYGRVVILHLTIIFGAFVVAFLGSPVGALLVLVTLKTAFDLGLHLREHRGAPAP